MGMRSVQALIRRWADPLQRSVSHTEQCSTLSLKMLQALSCPPCFVHERVMVLTPPPTVKWNDELGSFPPISAYAYRQRRFSCKLVWFQELFQRCQALHNPDKNRKLGNNRQKPENNYFSGNVFNVLTFFVAWENAIVAAKGGTLDWKLKNIINWTKNCNLIIYLLKHKQRPKVRARQKFSSSLLCGKVL